MDGKTIAMVAGIALALLVTVPLPIYVTRKRLRNEWARYEARQKRLAESGGEGSTNE